MADKTCKTCKWWDDGECGNITWRLNNDHDENYENQAYIDVDISDDTGLNVRFVTPASFGCNKWEL